MVIVILLFLIVFCANAQIEKAKLTEEEKEASISKQWLTLGEKIKHTNTELMARFNDGDASAMVDLFGDHDIIFSPKGEIYKGKQKILAFWNEIIKRKATDLDFKTINVFISDVIEENPDQYDYIAYEIGEYSYTSEGKVFSGSYIHIRWHVLCCPWSP
jgi:ketosteroid isomerase-like protein